MKNLTQNIKELFQIMSPKQKNIFNSFLFLLQLHPIFRYFISFALLTIIVSDVSSFKIPLLDFDIYFFKARN